MKTTSQKQTDGVHGRQKECWRARRMGWMRTHKHTNQTNNSYCTFLATVSLVYHTSRVPWMLQPNCVRRIIMWKSLAKCFYFSRESRQHALQQNTHTYAHRRKHTDLWFTHKVIAVYVSYVVGVLVRSDHNSLRNYCENHLNFRRFRVKLNFI